MNEILKNSYRLLTFDKVDSNDTMFVKNSKISYKKDTLVYSNGGLPIGIAFVTIDDIGLLCDIYFTQNLFYDDIKFIGEFRKVKCHIENGIRVVDEANLVGINYYNI